LFVLFINLYIYKLIYTKSARITVIQNFSNFKNRFHFCVKIKCMTRRLRIASFQVNRVTVPEKIAGKISTSYKSKN